jgi:hypothetical protein
MVAAVILNPTHKLRFFEKHKDIRELPSVATIRQQFKDLYNAFRVQLQVDNEEWMQDPQAATTQAHVDYFQELFYSSEESVLAMKSLPMRVHRLSVEILRNSMKGTIGDEINKSGQCLNLESMGLSSCGRVETVLVEIVLDMGFQPRVS